MLVTTWWEHLTFQLGSGDLHDIRHAKPTQLANLPCSRILVWEPPADEFLVFVTRRVLKNRNSFRDAAQNEIRRFEHPGTAGIRRDDNDIGRRDRFMTTSAHPAVRRTDSPREGTTTIIAAANATTTSIRAHLGRVRIHLVVRWVSEDGQRPSDKKATRVLGIHADGLSYRLITRNVGMSKNTVMDIVRRNTGER